MCSYEFSYDSKYLPSFISISVQCRNTVPKLAIIHREYFYSTKIKPLLINHCRMKIVKNVPTIVSLTIEAIVKAVAEAADELKYCNDKTTNFTNKRNYFPLLHVFTG